MRVVIKNKEFSTENLKKQFEKQAGIEKAIYSIDYINSRILINLFFKDLLALANALEVVATPPTEFHALNLKNIGIATIIYPFQFAE